MSLQHAICVSLAEQSASGYELTRRFDRSLGFFWSASHQQIYRTLARMEELELVSATVEPGEGAPARKVYGLTAAGRAELTAWTREPSPPERPRPVMLGTSHPRIAPMSANGMAQTSSPNMSQPTTPSGSAPATAQATALDPVEFMVPLSAWRPPRVGKRA